MSPDVKSLFCFTDRKRRLYVGGQWARAVVLWSGRRHLSGRLLRHLTVHLHISRLGSHTALSRLLLIHIIEVVFPVHRLVTGRLYRH